MNRKQKHNRLLVFDMEMCCWETIREDGTIDKSPPDGMSMEIIQFGYAVIDMKTREIIEKESWTIKPKKSTISEFCTELTGITQKQVDDGISFEKFRKELSKKGFQNIVNTSWGYGDKYILKEYCDLYKLDYPLSLSHFCSKTLFSTYIGNTKGFGVKKALNKLGLEFEGQPHNAMWDAYNTAKILINSIYI